MLDMAFQLLAFFILTFRPAPLEGQISLRLPPAQVVANATGKNEAGNQDKPAIDIKGVDTLTITIFANEAGDFGTMGVGQNQAKDLGEMEKLVSAAFKDQNSPFEQVMTQSSPKLKIRQAHAGRRYLFVQRLPGGKLLGKLSFIEIPEGKRNNKEGGRGKAEG